MDIQGWSFFCCRRNHHCTQINIQEDNPSSGSNKATWSCPRLLGFINSCTLFVWKKTVGKLWSALNRSVANVSCRGSTAVPDCLAVTQWGRMFGTWFSCLQTHYRQQTVEARVPEPSATHLHCYLSQRRPSISHIVAWCNSQSTACISYSKSISRTTVFLFFHFLFFFKENSMDNRKNKTHVRDDDSYQANPQSTIPHPHRNRKTKSSCSKWHAYTTWGLSTSKDHPTHECKSKHAVCSHTRNGDEIPQTPGPPLHPKMEGNGTQ